MSEAQPLFERGMAALEAEDFPEAVEAFTRAIAHEPRVAAGYRYRARAYLALNDRPRAIADYDVAIRLRPNEAQLHAERAAELLKQRRFADAIDDCNTALQLEAGRVDVLAIRARAYAESGNAELAFEDYQTAMQVDPDHAAEYLTQRAILHHDCGNPTTAITDADAAIRLDPNHGQAYEIRAMAHQELGNLAAAERDYAEASRDEANTTAQLGRLAVLYQLEEWNDVISLAHELLAKHPHFVQLHDYRGRAALALGGTAAALADFTVLVEKLPRRAIGYTLRGQAYEQANDYSSAVQNYLQALQREPNDAGTLNQLAWLYATAEPVKDAAKAKEFATRACERTGFADAGYLDTLAVACAEHGEVAAAMSWWEKAVQLDDRPEYRERLELLRTRPKA
jgi:tetratricopeptide (TPR) repeat protein